MSAALLQELVEAGVPAALVARVAEELADARAEAKAATAILEGRRSRDRVRKAGIPQTPRNSTEAAEVLAPAEPPISTSENNKQKQDPLSPPKGGQFPHAKKTPLPLPADWKPDEADIAYAGSLGFSRDEAFEIGEDMRVWAVANDIRKANWRATYQGFCRRDAKEGRHKRGPPGRPTNGHSPPPLTGYTQVLHELRRQRDEDPRDHDEPAVPLLPRH